MIDSNSRRRGVPNRSLISLIVVGVLARLVVIGATYGSNDMATWERFAGSIRANGIGELYATDSLFNHPPIMGYMAAGLHRLAEVTGIPFEYLFKAPMFLGDMLILWLLWTIWAPDSKRNALAAMAVFACNPISILVTAHHGNTDSLVGALCLLAARQHSRGAMFTTGLALAAAGNVKIVAALCVPALLALVRDRASLARMLAGGMIGAVPFVAAAAFVGQEAITNVFLYNSLPGHWGFSGLAGYPFSRLVLLVGIIGFTILGRRRNWSSYRAVALAFGLFLVIASGWGVQYHVWMVGALAAWSTTWSKRYALIVGPFVAATYLGFMRWEFPLESVHTGGTSMIVILMGLAGWIWMTFWMYSEARQAPAISDNASDHKFSNHNHNNSD